MSNGQGSITFSSPSGGGGSTPPIVGTTVQFMFVVGGPNNFASILGAPPVPVAGDVSMTTALLAGVNVRMSRNGEWQEGFNPLDGNTYYTKVKAANVIDWFGPLGPFEEIIIETIPI
jgi:hypothetical protein